jgi:hypothetical protein
MPQLLNRARMTVSGTPGAGNITLNAAVTNYQTFAAAGATNGMNVRYVVEDGTAWEIGSATYSTTGPALTSRTLLESSSGSLLSLTSSATVFCDAAKEDLFNNIDGGYANSVYLSSGQSIDGGAA